MVYSSRRQAGRVLFEVLKSENTEYDTIAIMMNGAVAVGSELSKLSGRQMKLLFVKKIGLPGNNEYAIACVTDKAMVPNRAVKDNANLRHYIEITKNDRIRNIDEIREELSSKISEKLGEDTADELLNCKFASKKVLLVDDGMATGTSVMCAVKHLRSCGAAMITVAVPISSKEAAEAIESVGVKVVCPIIPESFYAVGQFYDEYPQLLISDVIAILNSYYIGRMPKKGIRPRK